MPKFTSRVINQNSINQQLSDIEKLTRFISVVKDTTVVSDVGAAYGSLQSDARKYKKISTLPMLQVYVPGDLGGSVVFCLPLTDGIVRVPTKGQ